MFRIAYYSFIPALLALPAQLVAGGPVTRLMAVALWLLFLGSLTAGLLRRP